MAVILGTDGYRYEVNDGWAKLPPGMEFNADVAAVGVDKDFLATVRSHGWHNLTLQQLIQLRTSGVLDQ